MTIRVAWLLLIRQCKHVQRKSLLRWIDFRRDRIRHQPWTTAASTCRYRDVLLAVDAVGHRESLNSRSEFGFPKHLAALDIDGFEHLITIADESHTARRRDDAGQESGALLEFPHFFQSPHV